jgi:hypothetical protein
MSEFEPGPHCQLCELLLVVGWGWVKKNCSGVLEQVHDPDRLCLLIGNELAHAERMTYRNEQLNKKVFCLALDLTEAKKKPPPPMYGDYI